MSNANKNAKGIISEHYFDDERNLEDGDYSDSSNEE